MNSPKLFHYQQNQIMKLSHTNRLLFIRLALWCSIASLLSITAGCSTNSWLYTSEWLKYYEPENGTVNDTVPEYLQPHFYKNATMGPWIWCWTDPRTAFTCFSIDHLQFEESSDTTTSVEIAVRNTVPVAGLAAVLVCLSLVTAIVCAFKSRSYRLVLAAGVLQIFTGGLGGISNNVVTAKQTGRGRRYRRISSKSMEKFPNFNSVAVETVEEDEGNKQSSKPIHKISGGGGFGSGDQKQQNLSVANVGHGRRDQSSRRRSSFLGATCESPSWCGGSSVMSLTTAI